MEKFSAFFVIVFNLVIVILFFVYYVGTFVNRSVDIEMRRELGYEPKIKRKDFILDLIIPFRRWMLKIREVFTEE